MEAAPFLSAFRSPGVRCRWFNWTKENYHKRHRRRSSADTGEPSPPAAYGRDRLNFMETENLQSNSSQSGARVV